MPNIAKNINSIAERIKSATQQANRSTADIALLAVSKTQPADMIRQAHACGLYRFGENYLQEALQKQTELTDLTNIEWHFIGPVQSNKTRKIAENFDWLHTIDRIKIATRLSEQRPASLSPLNACLQINIDDEASKAGVTPQELPELALAIAELANIRLRGLMVIPSANNNTEQQHQAFARTRALLIQLQQLMPEQTNLDTLSMGMSGDLEAAIAEGATLVRIGTDIFGARQPSNKVTQQPHNLRDFQ